MVNNNSFLYSSKIILEFIGDILYFPIWWFTGGLIMIVKKNFDFLASQQKNLGLFIWIRNIFKPMYGQRDFQGRLISFFMRLFQIALKTISMIFLLIFSLIFILLWIIFPFFVFYQIAFQIYPNIFAFIVSLFNYAK